MQVLEPLGERRLRAAEPRGVVCSRRAAELLQEARRFRVFLQGLEVWPLVAQATARAASRRAW
eukprot:6678722-Lingulodinium_polyedra.AAC.1